MGSKLVITIKGEGVGSKIAKGAVFALNPLVGLAKKAKDSKNPNNNILSVRLDDKMFELDMNKESYTFDVEPGEHAIAARDPRFVDKNESKTLLKAGGSFVAGMLFGGSGAIESIANGMEKAAQSVNKSADNKDSEEWSCECFTVEEGQTENVVLQLTGGGKVKIMF